MANLELLLFATLGLAMLAYLLGKANKTLGSVITILGTGLVFGSLAYYGFQDLLDMTTAYLPDGLNQFSASSLSHFFAILVSFIYLMVAFFNPYYINKQRYPALYSFLFLLSLTGVIALFYTTNFLSFFFFFELVVWSSLFLIPLGRSRLTASLYYGFSAFGGFSLLVAILLMYSNTGSLDITTNLLALSGSTKVYVFLLMMIAALSKLGAFPFHIWLPSVLTDAPDPITAMFSGGLEKLGAFVAVFALVRLGGVGSVISAFDISFFNYLIMMIGAVTIVIGTLMAIRQDDAKTLLAYSSMSNGGYILVALGLMTTTSVSGGLLHVFAHAIASTSAFLAIGAVARQTKTTKISELGGMIHKMPITYLVYLIAIISMAGIPPMGGFISKWLIFQGVINEGFIFVAIATFFGSIGSFLYVFRPLAALFLGQELPEYKTTVKEAPVLLLIPMLILSLINIASGIVPNYILQVTNKVLTELNIPELSLTQFTIQGNNGDLHPLLIASMFAIGVGVAFIIFILLKKSKKVELMDTYTAGNFVYTEQHLHYTKDFYAPLERLYENYIDVMKRFYHSLSVKVKELGEVVQYYFFTYKPEITVFWILVLITLLLWGDIV